MEAPNVSTCFTDCFVSGFVAVGCKSKVEPTEAKKEAPHKKLLLRHQKRHRQQKLKSQPSPLQRLRKEALGCKKQTRD